MRSFLCCLTALLFWVGTPVSAGWNTSVTASLAWPPVVNQGDVTSWPTPNPPYGVFPCEREAQSAALYGPRIDFPLTGGRFQFDLVNSTHQLSGQKFFVSSYFGQMSIDASADQSGWAGISTLVYDDFETGPQCTESIDVPSILGPRPYFTSKVGNEPSALEGANVTLGLTIWLSAADGENNIGEIFQCAYLRLVSATAPVTQDRGVCNVGALATPTNPTLTASATIEATSTNSGAGTLPSSSNTSTGSASLPSQNTGLKSNTIIGIVVGIVMAIASVLVVGGYILFRRRRQQRPTIALDFWINGMPWHTRRRPESAKGGIASVEKGKLAMNEQITTMDEPDIEKRKLDAECQTQESSQKILPVDKKDAKLSSSGSSISTRHSNDTESEADTLPRYEESRTTDIKGTTCKSRTSSY